MIIMRIMDMMVHLPLIISYFYGYDGSLKENTSYKPVLRFKYEAIL